MPPQTIPFDTQPNTIPFGAPPTAPPVGQSSNGKSLGTNLSSVTKTIGNAVKDISTPLVSVAASPVNC